MLGQDGHQILVKCSSYCIRVHLCILSQTRPISINPKTNNTTKSLNTDTNPVQTNHKTQESDSDGENSQQNINPETRDETNQQDDIDNLSALLERLSVIHIELPTSTI